MTETKKLTLKLVKKTSSDNATTSDVQAKPSSRASVFVVPEKPAYQPSYASRQPRNLDFLNNLQKAKSNISIERTADRDKDRDRDTEREKAAKVSKFGKKERASRINISTGAVHELSSEVNAEYDPGWRRAKTARKGSGKPLVKKVVSIHDKMTVQTLANNMAVTIKALSRELFKLGVPSKPEAEVEIDTAELIVEQFGHTVKKVQIKDVDEDPVEDYEGEVQARPPIVAIVGHVDHGKTSLLDVIRKTHVTDQEAGGITQHIGAYQAKSSKGQLITFLDTPGHEAFTGIRARGVQLTDIVLLVVAADDGIKAQTVEAIKHIKQSTAQVIVVITKIDKPTANPTRVLEELLSYDIVTEIHSGDIVAVQVSALQNKGIDQLLDAIALQAEIMELKARKDGHAVAIVLETAMKKGFGHTANVLVQKGELKVGQCFVVGETFGKVKCLIDSAGQYINSADPSMPVSVVGLDGPAKPSDRLVAVPTEQIARSTAQARLDKPKPEVSTPRQSLFDLFKVSEVKSLPVLLKADTMGSLEALKQSLANIKNSEVEIKILDSSVGNVTEGDIMLAQTSKAMIIGFNITAPGPVAKIASQKFVHIMTEKIIYRLLEALQDLVDSMMKPIVSEVTIGKAQVIKLFKFSKGTVAGCKVLDGKILQGSKLKIWRGDKLLVNETIKSLQKAAESAKEALKGQECGIMTASFHDYELGDVLECYTEETKAAV